MNTPVTAADPAQASLWLTQEVVAAVRKLNRPEFLERGRELKVRRPGRKPVVEVVDLETGEILDELPPEEVLRMAAELEKEREGEM